MYSREKLKKLREARGLTQYELAEIAGISVVTLNKIESSDSAKPFAKTLNKIAKALEVEINELSESEGKSSPDVFSEINAMYSREKLKKLREARGLTQYELAEIAGISVVTLNKIESSDSAKPFAKTLNKIARALGVGIDELSESEGKSSPDVFSEINAAICSRAKVIADLMKIDSFMFGYIQKQLDIFRRDLCQFFGISDSILLEAVLFSGASWSRPGNTTHESHFPEVLGDLLALQGISIPVDRKNIIIDTEDKIEEYAKARCVYGICNREGELLRIGETIDLPRRFHEHISKLKKEEYPSMKKYLKGTAQFRIDYHFKLLAFEPEKLSGLQSATWRYYAETKLILEEKTYLKGNSYNGKAIVTGDNLIPEHVQREMIQYYHNIEL